MWNKKIKTSTLKKIKTDWGICKKKRIPRENRRMEGQEESEGRKRSKGEKGGKGKVRLRFYG